MDAFLVTLCFCSLSGSLEAQSQLARLEGSTLVPTLDTKMLIFADAKPNKILKEFLTQQVRNPHEFAGKTVAVLATDGVEEIELIAPVNYFRDRGAKVEVVSPRFRKLAPSSGVKYPDQRRTHILTVQFMKNASWVKIDRFLDEANASDYDALLIPGGAWNPDILRHDKEALALIKNFSKLERPLGAICHGPLVFVSAGLTNGKKMTGYWNIQIDLKNAGAELIEAPVVVDENLITSRCPCDIPQFVTAIADRLNP